MGWIDEDDAEPERQKYREAQQPKKGPPIWVSHDSWSVANMPIRQWVSKGYLIRGSVTLVVGAPATMKSSMMLAWACALTLDKDHSTFHPEVTGPVIVYNVEDDQWEQRRRLSATLEQFKATPDDIKDKIILTGPSAVGTLFVRTKNGYMQETGAMQAIRELIEVWKPIALFADPLAELHNCEENDNTALRAVVAQFRALAREFNVAVVLVHHIPKGAAAIGNPDAARGASAIGAAARIMLTLTEMTEKDAEEFSIQSDRWHRSRYVRLDDAKQSYAGFDNPRWFEKKVYLLANGEDVAAMVPWVAPDKFEDIDIPTANAILDEIDLGMDKGVLYNISPSAKNLGAWTVVMRRVPGCTEHRAREIIKRWVTAGMFVPTQYDKPNGQKGNGARVNSEKRPHE